MMKMKVVYFKPGDSEDNIKSILRYVKNSVNEIHILYVFALGITSVASSLIEVHQNTNNSVKYEVI